MKKLVTLIAVLALVGSASADLLIGGPDQDTTDAVTVTGDSYATTWQPEATADGSGLNASLQHDNDYTNMSYGGGGQWVTADDPGIPKGWAWWQYEFDAVYPLTTMWVWNGNQAGLTERGLRHVWIYHSTDHVTWTPLANGDNGHEEFPQADGTNTYAGFQAADFGGVDAKYVVITADTMDSGIWTYGRGNWGGQSWVRLSEVNFNYVPEPVTALVLCLGGGLALLRRKRS